MMMNKKLRALAAAGALCMCVSLLGGCVDQEGASAEESAEIVSVTTDCKAESPETVGAESDTDGNNSTENSDIENVETLLQIDDPEEKAAVEAAKKKVLSMGSEPRIIATSPATADICDKLNLDLVGVCSSTISSLPERYADITTVGGAHESGYGDCSISGSGLDFESCIASVGSAAEI